MFLRKDITAVELLLSDNLREFAMRAGTIASLETGGKLTTKQALDELAVLWQQLDASVRELAQRPRMR